MLPCEATMNIDEIRISNTLILLGVGGRTTVTITADDSIE